MTRLDDLPRPNSPQGAPGYNGGNPGVAAEYRPITRQEDFENAYYVRDRYQPTCMRVQGEGAELSRVVCRRPEE